MSALKCSQLKVLSHQSPRHESALYDKGRDLSTDKTFNFEFDFNCCHHVASSTRINTFWVNKRMWWVDRIGHVHVSIFNFPSMQQRPQPSPVVQRDDWRDDIKLSHNFQQEIWFVTIKSSSIVSSTQRSYDVFFLLPIVISRNSIFPSQFSCSQTLIWSEKHLQPTPMAFTAWPDQIGHRHVS